MHTDNYCKSDTYYKMMSNHKGYKHSYEKYGNTENAVMEDDLDLQWMTRQSKSRSSLKKQLNSIRLHFNRNSYSNSDNNFDCVEDYGCQEKGCCLSGMPHATHEVFSYLWQALNVQSTLVKSNKYSAHQ